MKNNFLGWKKWVESISSFTIYLLFLFVDQTTSYLFLEPDLI